MPDHDIEQGRRIMALARLNLTEARCRAALAKSLLAALSVHSHDISRNDAHDFAYAVWAEFRGDGGRTDHMPLELQAGVFAQVALWLDHDVILRIARDTWGSVPVDAADGDERVQWLPDDDALILTVRHLLSDGTEMIADVVVTPGRLAGATR